MKRSLKSLTSPLLQITMQLCSTMPELQEVLTMRELEQLKKVHKNHRSSKVNVIFVAFKTRLNKEYGKNNTTYVLPPIMLYIYAHTCMQTCMHICMHECFNLIYSMTPYICGEKKFNNPLTYENMDSPVSQSHRYATIHADVKDREHSAG